jgi:hypothetical protein
MLKKCLCVAFLVHSVAAPSATVELKGNASVTGKILVEKRDMIVVDIGYTALVIPRSQILRLLDRKSDRARSPAESAPGDRGPCARRRVLPKLQPCGAREYGSRTGQ